MAKFLFILLASTFLSFCQAQSFELFNGDTINRIDSKDQKQGLWILFDLNNNVRLKCNYKDDLEINILNYFDKDHLVLKLQSDEGDKRHFTYYGATDSIQGIINVENQEYLLENNAPVDTSLSRKLSNILEIFPLYPGGMDSLSSYLKNNLKFPEKAKEKGKGGKVKVSFIINGNGFVTDIEIKQTSNKLFNEEALRVANGMKRWQPGHQNGRMVKVAMVLPFKFNLGSE